MIRESKKRKYLLGLIDMIGRIFFLPIKFFRNTDPIIVPDIKKILIIEPWGIGDLVLASGCIRELRKAIPEAEICLLAKEYSKDIFGQHSMIDKYLVFDLPWTVFKGKYKLWKWDISGLIKFIRQLQKEKFDLVLDARGDFRNNLLSFLTRGTRGIGFDWTGGDYFLTDPVSCDYKNIHRIHAWQKILERAGIKPDDLNPSIEISQQQRSRAVNFLKDNSINTDKLLIGVHPGARIKTRCWSLEKFAETADYLKQKYNAEIIIFEEPDGYGHDIAPKTNCIKVAFCLQELIGMFSRLDLLICNDGGPMHIATAVNTAVLAIFGPTNPVWFGPCGEKHRIVIDKSIDCRGCFDYCIYDEPVCVNNISVETVCKEADSMISQTIKKGLTPYIPLPRE